MTKKINNLFYISQISLLIITLGIFLLPKDAYSATINPETIINLTNTERNKIGLPALTENSLLAQAALAKGETILASQQFQHNFPDKKFSSWIKETGYQYSQAGENLAINFATSEGVIKAWLNSQTHKENLLNANFSDIGVAVIKGKFQSNDTILVVQIFASPLNQVPSLPLSDILTTTITGNINTLANLNANNVHLPSGTNEYYRAGLKYQMLNNVLENKIFNNNLENWMMINSGSHLFALASLMIIVAPFLLFCLFNFKNQTAVKRRSKLILSPLK